MKELARLPKKITPDFLASTTVEIRFLSNLPQDQIVGMTFAKLQPAYPQVEVVQKPINFAAPNYPLVETPDFNLKNSELQIGIGKNVVTISCIDAYIGWALFSERISDVCRQLTSIPGLITKATRLGLRFVNFLSGMDNIDEVFDLDVVFPDSKLFRRSVFSLREELQREKYNVILNIANRSYLIKSPQTVPLSLPMNEQPTGIVLDIDVYLLPPEGVDPIEIEKEIAELHGVEKRMFYSLLKDAFIAGCKPEY